MKSILDNHDLMAGSLRGSGHSDLQRTHRRADVTMASRQTPHPAGEGAGTRCCLRGYAELEEVVTLLGHEKTAE